MCVLGVLRDEQRLMRDQLCSKGCSTRWALIRELWKGEANPKATAAASNLHRLYGQTVRNDAAPSKTAARGTMLKDLLSHAMAFILISRTWILVVHCLGLGLQYIAIHCFYNTLPRLQCFYIHAFCYFCCESGPQENPKFFIPTVMETGYNWCLHQGDRRKTS